MHALLRNIRFLSLLLRNRCFGFGTKKFIFRSGGPKISVLLVRLCFLFSAFSNWVSLFWFKCAYPSAWNYVRLRDYFSRWARRCWKSAILVWYFDECASNAIAVLHIEWVFLRVYQRMVFSCTFIFQLISPLIRLRYKNVPVLEYNSSFDSISYSFCLTWRFSGLHIII